MGLKPPDYFSVPLTADEHAELHSGGEHTFWDRHNFFPAFAVIDTMAKYIIAK